MTLFTDCRRSPVQLIEAMQSVTSNYWTIMDIEFTPPSMLEKFGDEAKEYAYVKVITCGPNGKNLFEEAGSVRNVYWDYEGWVAAGKPYACSKVVFGEHCDVHSPAENGSNDLQTQ